MAGGLGYTEGSGKTINTDRIGVAGGIVGDVQFVKLVDGTVGGGSPVAADANGLDVDVTRVVPGTGATNLGKAEDSAHVTGDTGVAAFGVRRDDPSGDGAYTDASGDYILPSTDSKGAIYFSPRPVSAVLSNVSGSASSVTLLAANTNRKGFVIVNDSTAVCYVKFGSTASATSHTYQLQSGDILDKSGDVTIYVGIITAIWASATGAARCTELSG